MLRLRDEVALPEADFVFAFPDVLSPTTFVLLELFLLAADAVFFAADFAVVGFLLSDLLADLPLELAFALPLVFLVFAPADFAVRTVSFFFAFEPVAFRAVDFRFVADFLLAVFGLRSASALLLFASLRVDFAVVAVLVLLPCPRAAGE